MPESVTVRPHAGVTNPSLRIPVLGCADADRGQRVLRRALSYLAMHLRMGSLDVVPALDRPDLLAPPVAAALAQWKNPVPVTEIGVAEIDPELADTAAFCERYGVAPGESANCVVIAGRRGGETKLAACVVLATTRADVNGLGRRQLDARKASFAPVEAAVAATGMEYGGITPIGLPDGWPILIDAAVTAVPRVVVGSGVRRSKLALPGAALAGLPGAAVLEGFGMPVASG